MQQKGMRRIAAALFAVAVTGTLMVAAPVAASAAPNGCQVGDLTVERWVDGRNNVVLTTNATEETMAANAGYTATGEAFSAFSTKPTGVTGIKDVTPVYSTSTSKNQTYILWDGELQKVLDNKSYVVNGTKFWVSSTAISGCDGGVQKVTRQGKGAIHTLAYSDAEIAANTAAGWTPKTDYAWWAPKVKSAHATDNTGCYSGDLIVDRWVDSRNNVRLTTSDAEAAQAHKDGYAPTGEAFVASSSKPTAKGSWEDVAPFLSTSTSKNQTYLMWGNEVTNVTTNGSYTANGAPFWVSAAKVPNCDDQFKVTRQDKGGFHTLAYSDAEIATNVANGWTAKTGYAWYAPIAETRYPNGYAPTEPEDGGEYQDGVFSMVGINDTQNEVFDWAGSRFINRTQWIAANADALDLRFISHTGDIVNWWEPSETQYKIADTAMKVLVPLGVPIQVSVGNHDTMATGEGGSARDATKTYQYQRDTSAFNRYFTYAKNDPTFTAFEAGKVDNSYVTFEAEGKKWMSLNVELWPRASALEWAKNAIASHPDYNVIIQSHNLLNGSCSIDGAGQDKGTWQYGDSSPQRVWNQLVEGNSNVKIVTSGHTGSSCSKLFTTANGNKVLGTLQNLMSNTQNSVRLYGVDVDKETIKTWVYSPEKNTTVESEKTYTLDFVG